jgi:putative flippase GtrA
MSFLKQGSMRPVLKEFLGYGAASALAFAVDIGVLWTLVHFLSYPKILAASISFCVGILVSYALSVTWVFQHRRLQDKPLELASFAAIGAIGLGVNAVVMSIAIQKFGVHYLLAKCMAAGLTFACNFISRRQLLFVAKRHPA